MLSETRITSCQQLKELKCPADDTFCHGKKKINWNLVFSNFILDF